MFYQISSNLNQPKRLSGLGFQVWMSCDVQTRGFHSEEENCRKLEKCIQLNKNDADRIQIWIIDKVMKQNMKYNLIIV